MHYMAIDQYGHTIHDLKHPRKDLMAYYNTQHADKMYVDTEDGLGKHIGYIVRGRWCTVYKVMRIDENG